jgi:hypothetical protein
MQAAEQQEWTFERIQAENEKLIEQEWQQYCQDEPGPPDEPGAGKDEPDTAAPGAGGRFPSTFVLKCLGQNQVGDAEIYKRLHRGFFLYDHAAGQWYRWAGHFWEPDRTESVVSAMQAVCRVYEIELQRVSWRANQARGKKDER